MYAEKPQKVTFLGESDETAQNDDNLEVLKPSQLMLDTPQVIYKANFPGRVHFWCFQSALRRVCSQNTQKIN